ncbi:MAG: hypothetical protein JWO84_602 [Parcubacteria group bacterium]|nr:hypothetical protein [Parcubacteria group bacterium]
MFRQILEYLKTDDDGPTILFFGFILVVWPIGCEVYTILNGL